VPIVVYIQIEFLENGYPQKFNRIHKNFAKSESQNSIVTFIFSQVQSHLFTKFLQQNLLAQNEKSPKIFLSSTENFFGLLFYI